MTDSLLRPPPFADEVRWPLWGVCADAERRVGPAFVVENRQWHAEVVPGRSDWQAAGHPAFSFRQHHALYVDPVAHPEGDVRRRGAPAATRRRRHRPSSVGYEGHCGAPGASARPTSRGGSHDRRSVGEESGRKRSVGHAALLNCAIFTAAQFPVHNEMLQTRKNIYQYI